MMPVSPLACVLSRYAVFRYGSAANQLGILKHMLVPFYCTAMHVNHDE